MQRPPATTRPIAAPSTNPWASRRVRRHTMRPIEARSSSTSTTTARVLPPVVPARVPVAANTAKLPITQATNPIGTPTRTRIHCSRGPSGSA